MSNDSLPTSLAFFFRIFCNFLVLVTFAISQESDELGRDIILIGTLDGKIHGLEANDGTLKWTMDTGGCMVSVRKGTEVFRLVTPSLDSGLCIPKRQPVLGQPGCSQPDGCHVHLFQPVAGRWQWRFGTVPSQHSRASRAQSLPRRGRHRLCRIQTHPPLRHRRRERRARCAPVLGRPARAIVATAAAGGRRGGTRAGRAAGICGLCCRPA